MTVPLEVPARRFWGESMSSLLGIMLGSWEARDRALDAQGWTGRRVLGMKIPDWQRAEVWTHDQEARFIESVYLGAGLGQYMLNDHSDQALSDIVIDGQQRLLALQHYWTDRFGIPGEDGKTRLWSDLNPDIGHARLLRISFPYLMTRYGSEALMQDAYNRHNGGGTPHRPEDMAPHAADLMSERPGMLPR